MRVDREIKGILLMSTSLRLLNFRQENYCFKSSLRCIIRSYPKEKGEREREGEREGKNYRNQHSKNDLLK